MSAFNNTTYGCIKHAFFNSLSANPTKWSNVLKQFVGNS